MKKFVAIAGNIGVGKSTLVDMLCAHKGWEPFYEPVKENPYLADFYAHMDVWAFHSQIFFLAHRLRSHHQLAQFPTSVVQDRSVYEDAEIFARNLYRQQLLSDRDWTCYYELYSTLSRLLRPPDLVIYLRAAVPTLQRRIAQRGRDYEQAIAGDYLAQLNLLYDQWSAGFTLSPVLIVETDKLDYVQYDQHLDQIWERIDHRLRGRDHLTLT